MLSSPTGVMMRSQRLLCQILIQGPPDTPYEDGVFELYCQFGADYPVKPPLVRFVTPVYHCNINSVGRICHNIFDRSYNAHITMREILDAVYGVLIVPEPQDPLDRLASRYLMTTLNTRVVLTLILK
uniref:UBC core domain-containing protein n=1 Tax=Hucho hucho TaxID=62062 RepID=A0A4W5JUM4_9TELE